MKNKYTNSYLTKLVSPRKRLKILLFYLEKKEIVKFSSMIVKIFNGANLDTGSYNMFVYFNNNNMITDLSYL